MNIVDIKIRLPYNPKLSERAKEMRKIIFFSQSRKFGFDIYKNFLSSPLIPLNEGAIRTIVRIGGVKIVEITKKYVYSDKELSIILLLIFIFQNTKS